MSNYLIIDLESVNPDQTIREIIEQKLERDTITQQTNLNTEDKKTDNNNSKKYYCNNPSCKKEITKAVVAYCLHEDNKERFQGKVYCIKCQEEYK